MITPGITPAPAADLCLGPSSSGQILTFDCPPIPEAYPTNWLGYDTVADPCRSGVTSDCLHTEGFIWTISSSDEDPFVNTGPLSGFPSLYLWFYCADFPIPGGIAAAEFDLVGSIDVLAFTHLNGFLNAGGPRTLLLAVGGCPRGPVVAGSILVNAATAAGSMVEVSSFGRVKALYQQ
jgi:hypothetical protein